VDSLVHAWRSQQRTGEDGKLKEKKTFDGIW